MSRPRKRIVFETQAPTVPGASAPSPSSVWRSSSNSTLITVADTLVRALPILFAFVSGYYKDLPDEALARRSELARMCKSINTVLSWPIVSMLACQSIDALSLVIITCVAIVLRFPNATELPAHPWDAALAILRSWAHYCLVPVLQAVLHELQVAGNRREEAGQSQIQHSALGTGFRPEVSPPTCEELAGADVPQDPLELSPQHADGPSLQEPRTPSTATVELAATDALEDSPESRRSPQPANGSSLDEPQAPLSAERGAEKTVTRIHRLPPTSSGTALPVALVRECLLHIALHFSEPDRDATLYAACLVSQKWRSVAQPYLYGIVNLHIQDDSERPRLLLASLLEFRRLAKYTVRLTLNVKGAALVDVAAVASLFGDFTRLQSLSLTFSHDDLFFLGPQWALFPPLRYLYLHGPISSLMLETVCCLPNLAQLTLDGPFVARLADFRRLPTFELEKLSISRDFPQVAIYRLTLLSFASLTKLSLTASDSEKAPELPYLVSLRELEILQPYRDAEPIKKKDKTVKHKPLDARAIATYVERLLASARRLPQLRCLAFLNPWDLEPGAWPDLHSKSASILKALPKSLIVLNLTSAVSAIDFMGLDKLVRDPKSRPVNLQVIAMDQEAKGSLPCSVEELERDWAENGVQISWTACRVHANFPSVTVTTRTETTLGEDSCH